MSKLNYWRLAIHLIFKTQHFGVNNQWWSHHPSAIGWTWMQRLIGVVTVMPILRNYQSLKVRSRIGWMTEEEASALFGKDPHFK